MRLFSVLSNSKVLIAALSVAFALGSNGHPIINSDHREEKLTSSRKGIETKEYSWRSARADINDATTGGEETYIVNIDNFAIDSANIRGNRKLEGKKIYSSSLVPVTQVIPKDPNSFFHPASLRHFKSSVASFEAWQHLHLFPDPHRLSRDKAQDVAAEIDHFIEKFSSATQSHEMRENPNSNL